MTEVFPGRVICKGMCGMPVTQLSPRGFCMSCEDEVKTAGTIAVLASKTPRKGFKEALAEVQRSGRPLTLDMAEAAEEGFLRIDRSRRATMILYPSGDWIL